MKTQVDITRSTKFVVSDTAPAIIALGATRHYLFRVVGSGPVPESEFLMGLWRVVPHSEPPIIAKKRIDLIRSAGYEIKGFVVIHEPEIAEPAPVVVPPQKQDSATPIISTELVGGVLVMGLLLIGQLFISAILADPSIVVVCGPENVWIEVMNYYE